MEQTSYLTDVPGAAEIVNWFGYWPTFHDAEIVSIELKRAGHQSSRYTPTPHLKS